MVAVAGGDDVPCVPYATFGSQALSDYVVQGLSTRRACLLAHHGLVATGQSLAGALKLAVEVEELATQFWRILQINPNPPLLPKDEMARVLDKFKSYGSNAQNTAKT
jgi:L-fuculose-phosphate aldolase